MDDIDVTSSMGRNRPCMFDVVEAAPRPRPDADDAGTRGGARRRPGARHGGDESAGRAGSPRLVPPPDQTPLVLEV